MVSEVAKAVDRFLDVFQGECTSARDIKKLMETLDKLAWLAHGEFECNEREYPEITDFDRQATFKKASRWLMSLRESESRGDLTTIDAIMDLSEIADDMEEISWRFRNTSHADAVFHFQLGFHSHWGHHLRSLQKTLHDWYW